MVSYLATQSNPSSFRPYHSLGSLILSRTEASSSLASPRATQALLRQFLTHSSFLKLQALYSKILLEQYRKSWRRVLRSGAMNHSKSWCVLVCSPTPVTFHSLHLKTKCFQLSCSESLKRCLRRYMCQKYSGEAICSRKLCNWSFSSSCSRVLFNKLNTKWSIFAADSSLLSWMELGLVKHWASWKKKYHIDIQFS
jgi:hypothetical protein